MTVNQVLTHAAQRLQAAGVESAPFEAQLLLAHALDVDRLRLLIDRDKPVAARANKRFAAYLKRRCAREPLQYITGQTDFYGHKIFVNKHVLIPRPETEMLVEQVVKHWQKGYRTILDIGTGSGCIAIALTKTLPGARVTAIDISARVLAVAKRNVEHHGLGKRVTFIKADLFPGPRATFGVIVSNPPYIPSQEIGSLQPEVSQYEPRPALDGGKDGLDFYRQIIAGCIPRLNKEGMIAFEIGQGQHGAVKRMFPGGFSVSVLPDLGGIPRVVVAVLRVA